MLGIQEKVEEELHRKSYKITKNKKNEVNIKNDFKYIN